MMNERRKGDRRVGAKAATQPASAHKPSARVFIHPRCWSGPAFGAMAASLEAHGVDTANVKVGPLATHNRRELVREIRQIGATTEYERMDGTRFEHCMGRSAPEPESA